jgi:hypothetical protein
MNMSSYHAPVHQQSPTHCAGSGALVGTGGLNRSKASIHTRFEDTFLAASKVTRRLYRGRSAHRRATPCFQFVPQPAPGGSEAHRLSKASTALVVQVAVPPLDKRLTFRASFLRATIRTSAGVLAAQD